MADSSKAVEDVAPGKRPASEEPENSIAAAPEAKKVKVDEPASDVAMTEATSAPTETKVERVKGTAPIKPEWVQWLA